MDAEKSQHQESQLHRDELASAKSALHQVDGPSHGALAIEKDLRCKNALPAWLGCHSLHQFINGALAEEHNLEATETDKPILEAEDLMEVLRCHWVTDTNIFPNERQRVQLATLLLFTAFTGSRPGALLAIRYRDIDLFVLRNPKTGEEKPMMQLRLLKTKSQLKQRRP